MAAMATRAAVRRLEDDEGRAEWYLSERTISLYFTVFLTLLAAVLLVSRWIHTRPRLMAVLPEALVAILIGIAASFVVWLVLGGDDAFGKEAEHDDDANNKEEEVVGMGLLSFGPTFFFSVLLPPIIFNSGYHVRRKLFYRHLRSILLFALLGTFLGILFMTGFLSYLSSSGLFGDFNPSTYELMAFASLISSTDPVSILAVFRSKKVDPQVFYLVFGESVLNDGVCLVLFDAFSNLVRSQGGEETGEKEPSNGWGLLWEFATDFCGSYLLGFVCGIVAAVLFKHAGLQKFKILEASLYVLVMYLPFFIADAVGLSPIVTILFTGVFSKQYAHPNLSIDGQEFVELLFRITSHLAETSIFLEIGLSLFGLFLSGLEEGSVNFFAWALLGCLLGRACSIYPMTLVSNATYKIEKKIFERREDRKLQKAVQDELKTEEGSVGYTAMMPPTTKDLDLKYQDQWIASRTAHTLWFSGLRGAVAYACAKNFPDTNGNRKTVVEATMFIVLATVFLFGCTADLVLRRLRIESGVDERDYVSQIWQKSKHRIWYKIDESYIRPTVIRNYVKKKHRGAEDEKRREELMEAIVSSAQELMQHSLEADDPCHIGGGDKEHSLEECEDILRDAKVRLRLTPNRLESTIYDFGRAMS